MAQVIDSSSVTVQKIESESLITRDGTTDYKGEPADKSKTGGFKVLPFIFGAEFAERTASNGVSINLVTYLFHVKHMHLSDAANLTTNYMGSSFLLTLLGGFVADSYLGRFWTILVSLIIEMTGCAVLVFNATWDDFKCLSLDCPPARGTDLALIYVGLYLLALGSGGIKSSVSGLGADQFEKDDPNEAKYLPHYFNWFLFTMVCAILVGQTFLVYIQDRMSWSWGFGTLLIIMFIALMLLFTFRKGYRYKIPQGSPFIPLALVLVAAVRNRKLPRPTSFISTDNENGDFYDVIRRADKLKVVQTNNMRWLDKAAIVPEGTTAGERGWWSLATVTEVENLKLVLRLLPIVATTWFFWTAESQFLTFTVAQAITTNRNWGDFQVPPASIGAMKTIFVGLWLIVYDRVLVRLIRKVTGHPSGLTTLQRIGVGLALSIVSMICAALVERRRLQEVHDLNWELKPRDPMESLSMFWYVPQYLTLALAEGLLYPAQLDFFYSESPENMQSLGSGLCLCTLSIGFFGSSAIVSTVNSLTHPAWLQDNINLSRLDNFFWTMAVLSGVNLIAFILVSRLHRYKKTYVPESNPNCDDEVESQDQASSTVQEKRGESKLGSVSCSI